NGTLNISNGAHVDAPSLKITTNGFSLQNRSVLNITGKDSVLNVRTSVLDRGGQFTVLNGSTVNVDDGALLAIDRNFDLQAGAKLLIQNGATVNDSITSASGSMLNGDVIVSTGGSLNGPHFTFTRSITIGAPGSDLPVAPGYINNDIVLINGSLSFNHNAKDYVFNNAISAPETSDRNLVNVVSGTTILNAVNNFKGNTLVNGGELIAGVDGAFSPQSTYKVNDNAILSLNGTRQTLSSLSNRGTVIIGGATPGGVLNLTGDYEGNNGLLIFSTKLGEDNSVTDKMNVQGNTSGTSRVKVENIGGAGNETINGIELISVGGVSAGQFLQEGRIVAGAYDYSLVRGKDGKNQNWYLTSEASVIDPGPDPENPDPGNPDPGNPDPGNPDPGNPDPGNPDPENPDPANPDPGTPPGIRPVKVIRPEAGAYLSNLRTARTMFDAPLNVRSGETHYVDSFTGEKKVSSLWLIQRGGHNRSSSGSGQLKTQSNRYTALIGGNIASGLTGSDGKWQAGILAGYGNSQGNTVSEFTEFNAKHNVEGYT
ncbi:autotransporter outer membrane beta-barrel domain-containing protein, partial [Pantoea endophytica]